MSEHKEIVNFMSTAELCERVNSENLFNPYGWRVIDEPEWRVDAKSSLKKLYLLDGIHFEDRYGRQLKMMEQELRRRGGTPIPFSAVEDGTEFYHCDGMAMKMSDDFGHAVLIVCGGIVPLRDENAPFWMRNETTKQ